MSAASSELVRPFESTVPFTVPAEARDPLKSPIDAPKRRSLIVTAALSLVFAFGAPIAWCCREALVGDEELAAVGRQIVLGSSADDVRRAFESSPHTLLRLGEWHSDAGRLDDILISTPYRFGADNSRLRVHFGTDGVVDCVLFSTADSELVRPDNMPPNLGCDASSM